MPTGTTTGLLSALDYWVRILLAIERHEEGTFTYEEVMNELDGITRAIDRSLGRTISPKREAHYKRIEEDVKHYPDYARESLLGWIANWRHIPDDEWEEICRNL